MNKRIHRISSIVLALTLIVVLAAPAFAVQNASDRIAATTAAAYDLGGGQVIFEFTLDATDVMAVIGFKQIKIYEQQSDGSYECVETLDENDHGFLFTNDDLAYGTYTYQGNPGTKHYARIQFYCKDSTGAESIYRNTNVV